MRKPTLAAIALIILRGAAAASATTAADGPDDSETHPPIVHPYPEYPYEARAKHFEGRGYFRLHVNTQTGAVEKVVISKSTGHSVLDQAAIRALRQWRFSPGTPKEISLPVDFRLSHKIETAQEARAAAIYASAPEYPMEARRSRLTGRGVFEFIVDKASGQVTDVVVVQTTGHGVLDNSVIRAFRKWRFKPGTVTRVRTPITFTLQPRS